MLHSPINEKLWTFSFYQQNLFLNDVINNLTSVYSSFVMYINRHDISKHGLLCVLKDHLYEKAEVPYTDV